MSVPGAQPAIYTAAVLTISDSAHRGEREGTAGPAVVEARQQKGVAVVATELVPDHRISIENALIRLCDRAQLVISTGGTGLAESDLTPEATESVADRLVPGLAERMRSEGAKKTPYAALSRGICAIRGSSLMLNLPGSPAAAAESLAAVIDVLP